MKRQAETKQQCDEQQHRGGMIKRRHGKMNFPLDATETMKQNKKPGKLWTKYDEPKTTQTYLYDHPSGDKEVGGVCAEVGN